MTAQALAPMNHIVDELDVVWDTLAGMACGKRTMRILAFDANADMMAASRRMQIAGGATDTTAAPTGQQRAAAHMTRDHAATTRAHIEGMRSRLCNASARWWNRMHRHDLDDADSHEPADHSAGANT